MLIRRPKTMLGPVQKKFREERAEIFDFLAENRIEGVILISADRHRSDAWRIERPNGYPLYEFESSRLTNEAVHKLMPGALFGYNEKQSFGLLAFDTSVPDHTVIRVHKALPCRYAGTDSVRSAAEIFDFLAENRIEGVILSDSADRHRSDY